MLRLAADENFNCDIVRGLLLRRPELSIVRVQDVGLAGADDRTVLIWAAADDRILLTHDRATLPDISLNLAAEGQPMAGVFVLKDRFPIGEAIREVLLMADCSEQWEWKGQAVYLPL